MTRLTSPLVNIKDHYTVVIIGSGYGVRHRSSRLARAGQQFCLLERGKEFQPGEYPDTEVEALAEMQTDVPLEHFGPRTGLYDFRINEDINVVLGCGLGGTSLINANVCIFAPSPASSQDSLRGPQAFRQTTLATLLAAGYQPRCKRCLQPQPVPDDYPALPKMEALPAFRRVHLPLSCTALRLYVTFKDLKDGVNPFGVPAAGLHRSAAIVSRDATSTPRILR